jgi:predicted transcriptional regulator
MAVYIHLVVRTQLYLDEELHRRLREAADRQGRTISDLVREAVARAYGARNVDERIATLEGIAGLWRDRDDLGDTRAYVRRLRRDTRRSRRRG